MIEAEHIGIKIPLKVLRADVLVSSKDTILDGAPQPFDIVDMGSSVHVLLGGVLNALMPKPHLRQSVIAREFVSIDDGVFGDGDVLGDDWQEALCSDIGSDLNHSLTASLHQSYGDALTFCTPATLSRLLTADVGLVNLNFSEQSHCFVLHHLSNPVKHAPCGLVRHTQLSFQVHGGDASPGVAHKEYGIKPIPERRSRLVIDGICRRMNMVSTVGTAIRATLGNLVMGSGLIAGLTKDAVGIKEVLQPFKAGIVVGESGVKLFLCKLVHRVASLLSRDSLTQCIPTVKG